MLHYIQGYLKIQLIGYSPERFLNLCRNKNISIWGLQANGNCYEMYMKVSGFRKLKPILKKTRTHIRILERRGFPFFFYKYRKRKIFFGGSILCIGLLLSFTQFLWEIDIQGNFSITDEVIEEYLESQEIYEGMKRNNIDCHKIAKQIRKNFPNIIWVSASLNGNKLQIEVKEKEDTMEKSIEENSSCDIVAEKAGKIVKMITRSGTPLVKIGDMVQEGDVLVSGVVDILNDAKEVESQKYVAADADIVVESTIQYQNTCAASYSKKKYTDKQRKGYYFRIFSYYLRIGYLREKFEEKEILLQEQDVALPITCGSILLREYVLEEAVYSEKEMEEKLQEQYKQYCEELISSGATILEETYEIQGNNEVKIGYGTLKIQEAIGIPRKVIDLPETTMLE